MALVRVGADDDRRSALDRLAELPWKSLEMNQRLTVARATAVAVARLEVVDLDRAGKLRRQWDGRFPSDSRIMVEPTTLQIA